MKRIKYNYYLIGIVCALLALALWPNIPWRSGNENQLQQVLDRGELRVSTIISPLSYQREGNTLSGLDYELAKRFADYLGVKLRVTVRPALPKLFDDLDGNDADLIAAGLLYNSERLQHYRTGPTYYSVSQQLVYRQGKVRPRNLGELNGTLKVQSGSAHITTLNHYRQAKYPQLQWQHSERLSANDLLKQVADGKLDYTVADSMVIALFQRIHPQVAVAFDISDEEPVMWYLKRNDDDSLYAAMLDFFSQSAEDGTLARLEEKYIGHVGSFDYVDTRTFLAAIDNVLPTLQEFFTQHARKMDWRLLAAVSYQESHWNPQATSPTGVRGLMMLTRATAEGLGVKDRLDPEESIAGGSLYLERLMAKLPESIPEDERIWFALAAYNMGYGHMLDVRQLTQQQGGDPDSWADVKQRLPLLSQRKYYQRLNYGYARGHEAYQYVENIRRYTVSLRGYLQEKEKREAAEATRLALLAQRTGSALPLSLGRLTL
ncbi:lytic transglycosylase F [Edwardsiella hoshinae]|uniref:Membrane-bound lytic murein transglycosylase F n=1 Tax=Edwardsiella hoshinae TaxID=93378 RepID=A0A376DKF4_9GAMM|nr:membrane-bound lytic murein transglycosylase MltF [Edwardsiella hoshinae]AOV97718.1 lytic transglycosylase F [Edwardsiella hoshinae]QPR29401.1 membrane-bound lytic murein transglycosylase MltF [Edwardsiella hoshinae]STC90599.1 Membrane-bound lytic murein transglycosylase F precursor [Edwardsiella hoshinae]